MISSKIEAGQVEIKRITLLNANRSSAIDLRSLLVEASFYEDITKPTLFCEISVIDGNNVRKTLPIIGEEFLEIEFLTPLFSDYKDIYGTVSFKNTFRIFSVNDLTDNTQSKKHSYSLLGVSEEQIKSSNISIEKGYNTTIDKAVKDVVLNYMSTKKNIITEDTKGLFPLVVPGFSPLKTIDWLRRRAVSPSYKSSSFVFFENSRGFNFRTLEGLIDDGVKNRAKMKYVHNPANNEDVDQPRKDELFNIIKFNEQHAFDTVDKIQLGAVDSVVETFDFLTKSTTAVSHDWEKVSHSFAKLNKGNESFSVNILREMDGIAGKLGNSKKSTRYFVPKDTSRDDHFIDSTLAQRQAFSVIANQNKLILYVYGNSILKVGDVINLEVLVPTRKVEHNSSTEKVESSVIKGNFLISRLRHIITAGQRFEHRVSLEVFNIGVKL